MPKWLERVVPGFLDPLSRGCCPLSPGYAAADDDEFEVSGSKLRNRLDPTRPDSDLAESHSHCTEHHQYVSPTPSASPMWTSNQSTLVGTDLPFGGSPSTVTMSTDTDEVSRDLEMVGLGTPHSSEPSMPW